MESSATTTTSEPPVREPARKPIGDLKAGDIALVRMSRYDKLTQNSVYSYRLATITRVTTKFVITGGREFYRTTGKARYGHVSDVVIDGTEENIALWFSQQAARREAERKQKETQDAWERLCDRQAISAAYWLVNARFEEIVNEVSRANLVELYEVLQKGGKIPEVK